MNKTLLCRLGVNTFVFSFSRSYGFCFGFVSVCLSVGDICCSRSKCEKAKQNSICDENGTDDECELTTHALFRFTQEKEKTVRFFFSSEQIY